MMRTLLRYRALRALALAGASLLIAAGPASGEETAVREQADSRLTLKVKPARTRIFLKERIPLVVSLKYPADLAVRDIRYPRLSGSSSVSRTGFDPPRQSAIIEGGENFVVQDFATSYTAETTGTVVLGPAETSCEISSPSDGPAGFFGAADYVRVPVRSQPVRIEVLTIPRFGRPRYFTGAVGSYSMKVTVAPTEVSAGDPVTVTTSLTGTGNTSELKCPKIELGAGFKRYGNSAKPVPGGVVCEEVIAPLDVRSSRIPEVGFSFFDPASASFRTIRKGPFQISVVAPPVEKPSGKLQTAVSEKASASPTPALSGTFAGRLTGMEGRTLVACGIAGAALLGGLVIVLRVKRKKGESLVEEHDPVTPSRRSAGSEELLGAFESGDEYRFYTLLFRQLQEMLAERCPVKAYSITEGVLSSENSNPDISHGKAIAELFSECNQVRYGMVEKGRSGMVQSLDKLKDLDPDFPESGEMQLGK